MKTKKHRIRVSVNVYIYAENIARENIIKIRKEIRKKSIKNTQEILKKYGVKN